MYAKELGVRLGVGCGQQLIKFSIYIVVLLEVLLENEPELAERGTVRGVRAPAVTHCAIHHGVAFISQCVGIGKAIPTTNLCSHFGVVHF